MSKPFNPAELTDQQTILLDCDNHPLWGEISDRIHNAAMALYPNADELAVCELIVKHLHYWAEAAQKNKALCLSVGELKATFLKRYGLELNYLNSIGTDFLF